MQIFPFLVFIVDAGAYKKPAPIIKIRRTGMGTRYRDI
jgi:hypothetical protein